MTEYFAHSPKDGYPAQTYAQHVNGVLENADEFASAAAQYSVNDGKPLLDAAKIAALYHDLGKLNPKNQLVLSGEKSAKALPMNHVDAGAAWLLDDEHTSLLAAVAVVSHHVGLPNFIDESNRGTSILRDDNVKDAVDRELSTYAKLHNDIVAVNSRSDNSLPTGDFPTFMRLLLSCLADADHTDTAVHYGKYSKKEPLSLRADERLARLGATMDSKIVRR